MTLIVELADNKEAALKAKAQAQGVSAEEFVAQILDRELDAPALTADPPRRHISEVIRDRMSKLPDEAWADMPADALSEIDHYVYGLPKRNT